MRVTRLAVATLASGVLTALFLGYLVDRHVIYVQDNHTVVYHEPVVYVPDFFSQVPPAKPAVLTLLNTNGFSADGGDEYHVTGQVHNGGGVAAGSLTLTATLYDSGGKVLAVATGEPTPATVDAGATSAFDIEFFFPPTGIARYDIALPRTTQLFGFSAPASGRGASPSSRQLASIGGHAVPTQYEGLTPCQAAPVVSGLPTGDCVQSGSEITITSQPKADDFRHDVHVATEAFEGAGALLLGMAVLFMLAAPRP